MRETPPKIRVSLAQLNKEHKERQRQRRNQTIVNCIITIFLLIGFIIFIFGAGILEQIQIGRE